MPKQIVKEIKEFNVLRKTWDVVTMRRKYSKKKLIKLLQTVYCVAIPWELDDALYYAKTVYPDIRQKDLEKCNKPRCRFMEEFKNCTKRRENEFLTRRREDEILKNYRLNS